MKHKHYDIIEEWARTGRQVQYMPQGYEKWFDFRNGDNCTWRDDCKYRFKPEIIKYKLYLIKNQFGSGSSVCVHQDGSALSEMQIKLLPGFAEWIDTEWVEYEI